MQGKCLVVEETAVAKQSHYWSLRLLQHVGETVSVDILRLRCATVVEQLHSQSLVGSHFYISTNTSLCAAHGRVEIRVIPYSISRLPIFVAADFHILLANGKLQMVVDIPCYVSLLKSHRHVVGRVYVVAFGERLSEHIAQAIGKLSADLHSHSIYREIAVGIFAIFEYCVSRSVELQLHVGIVLVGKLAVGNVFKQRFTLLLVVYGWRLGVNRA